MRSAAEFVVGSVVVLAWSSGAQEALRQSSYHDNVSLQRSRELESIPYTFRLRELRTAVSTAVGIEYNSNIHLLEGSSEDDFVFRPSLSLKALHPIGEANAITLSVDLSYSKYLEHNDLDQLTITPGSALSFDMEVQDFRINFHEQFSYQLDPTTEGAVSGVSEYGGFRNVAGARVTWDLQDVVLDCSYDFLRFLSTTSASDNESRSTHMFLVRGGVRIHPTLILGAEATASPTSYDETFHNDNVGYSVGGYAEWLVSERLSVQPRAGYVIYTFSDEGSAGEIEDFDSYYVDLRIEHRPNDWVNYSITAGRSILPGITGNLSDLWIVNGSATWSLVRHLPIWTTAFFEQGSERRGLLEEDYKRIGFVLGISREILEGLTGNISYGYIARDSEVAGRDYQQHRVNLQLTYRF